MTTRYEVQASWTTSSGALGWYTLSRHKSREAALKAAEKPGFAFYRGMRLVTITTENLVRRRVKGEP